MLAERAELERRVASRTSELERAQESLIHSEKMSAVGQLVAGVAHELNNPLTVVLGYAGLLLEQAKDPELRRRLEMISNEAQRSRKIVQNLLAFARKQKGERTEVDVNEAITRTVALRAYQLRNERIRVVTELDPALPPTWADFNQLQQVILNLLVNAEQAMQDSGRGSRIVVRTRKAAGRIEIEVEDDGPGIPAAHERRSSSRSSPRRTSGGGPAWGCPSATGFWPSTADRSGSRARKAGTRASCSISGGGGGDGAPNPGGAGPAPPGSRPRSEDPRHRRRSGRAPFRRGRVPGAFGAGPAGVGGGREGIVHLSRGEIYDAILSDMRMPDVDGAAVYRYVHERRPELERRLIFATGDVASPRAMEFLEASGRPVLEKPFSVQALRDTVRRVAR